MPIFVAQPQSRRGSRHRLILALLLGGCAALICWWRLHHANMLAADFTWPWRGARALLVGQNPYHVVQSTGAYPFDAPLYYPLPALLFVLPLAWLSAPVAGGVFMGISTALLVYGLTRHGYERLPVLLSLPFCNALIWPQWAPLITATLVSPALLPLALAKPSIGMAVFAARPSWRGVWASAALLAVSLVVLPTWPLDWLAAVRQHGGVLPLAHFPGPLVLLAALRWRDWRARLLLTMVCVPQIAYDVLPIWLVARTFRQQLMLSCCSWLSLLMWPYAAALHGNDWMMWLVLWIYLPALVLLLWPTPLRAAATEPTTHQSSTAA